MVNPSTFGKHHIEYANVVTAFVELEHGIAEPLSQVFNLGDLAQQLNTKLVFDRDKKQITSNKLVNEMLVGAPPRKGWEQFYKL